MNDSALIHPALSVRNRKRGDFCLPGILGLAKPGPRSRQTKSMRQSVPRLRRLAALLSGIPGRPCSATLRSLPG
jgi:hypothetical protein